MGSVTVTLTLKDLLLLLVAVSALTGLVYLVAVLRRFLQVALQVQRTVAEVQTLLREIRRVVAQTNETLESARLLLDDSRRVVGDARAVTGSARGLVEGLVRDLSVILGPVHMVAGLFEKIQSGLQRWAVFRRSGEGSKEESDEP